MSRLPSLFNTSVRSNYIGFDNMFDSIDDLLSMKAPNYPPYNITKKVIDGVEINTIELAVAGIDVDDVRVVRNENKLVVSYNKVDSKNPETDYIVKGISSRSFTLSFNLHPRAEVKNVFTKNGILSITIEKTEESPSAQAFKIEKQ